MASGPPDSTDPEKSATHDVSPGRPRFSESDLADLDASRPDQPVSGWGSRSAGALPLGLESMGLAAGGARKDDPPPVIAPPAGADVPRELDGTFSNPAVLPEDDPGFRVTGSEDGETDEGSPLPDRPRSFSRGEALRLLSTRFHVLGELGEGGMGLVLRAQDGSGRELAVKVVHSERITHRSLKRFQREGQVTAKLRHPGILRVHAAGDIGGLPYIAYELIPECRTLDEVVDSLGLRGQIELLRDVARALGHAHREGVVHRDVKPDNVLVDRNGRARVADFGLALMSGEDRLTKTGAMVGTPYYMAPETFAGERGLTGPPADVWALGVMLYRILTKGAYPFDGASLRELELRVYQANPEPVRSLEPNADPELEAICRLALEADPVHRYPNGDAFADDLDAWLRGEVVSASEHSGLQRAWRRHRAKLPFVLVISAALLILLAAGWNATRATGPAADRDPPRVVLRAVAGATFEDETILRGTVEDASAWVEVKVGRVSKKVLSGHEFSLELRLRAGRNSFEVEARDEAGNAAVPLEVVVHRIRVPRWYRELPVERRAPLPLPPGVELTEVRGEYRAVKDGSLLTYVPPGTYTRGKAPGEFPEHQDEEGPPHQVTLTRGFFLGKLEVSRAQYLAFCEKSGHPRPPPLQFEVESPNRHPVTGIRCAEAEAYCAWAGFRLPTEAEWEWAARGPDGRLFPWGNVPPGSGQANCEGGDPYPSTAPCGSFPLVESPFGNLDMAGNVWEWVSDRYTAYGREPLTDPTGGGEGKVLQRGGGWNSLPNSLRATTRSHIEPDYTNTASGFRVLLVYPPPPPATSR